MYKCNYLIIISLIPKAFTMYCAQHLTRVQILWGKAWEIFQHVMSELYSYSTWHHVLALTTLISVHRHEPVPGSL